MQWWEVFHHMPAAADPGSSSGWVFLSPVVKADIMVKFLIGAAATLCLLASSPASAQKVEREKILKDPKVFCLFVTLKVRPEYASLPSQSRGGAIGEVQSVVMKHKENVLADFYLTRGLDANSDILIRAHAYDLAAAQNFIIDIRATTLGRYCDVRETFIGMTSTLIYANRNPPLMDSLKATPYSDDPPRYAIMIPIKKSADWWSLPQEERQKLIEEHTVRTLSFLVNVKRKLYHSTGLDDVDFMTFFEVNDLSAFHEMSKVLMSVGENHYHVQWGNPIVVGRIDTLENVLKALAGN
jgi:chlorite dismutase